MSQSRTDPQKPRSPGTDFPGMLATLQKLEQELDRQRQQAQAAERLQWEFLRHVGHEIRNPMTAIIGMTDLALLTSLTDEQREYLTTVQNAARQLMRVLNNVQDYSRLQAGTLELEWSGFRLRACLKETLRKLAPQAHAKGLELLCRVAADAPDLVVADLRRLVQGLEHLLHNAILYTNRGEVALEVALVDESDKEVKLRFVVRDTGIGMPPEEAQRAMTVWMRPRTADARTRTGAGLGLPIVAGLVQMFGGKLKIQSSLSQGTQCEFTVRFLKQQTLMEPQRDPAASIAPLAGKRVLVVAGNDTARRWLVEMCNRLGMQTLISEPALQAAVSCAASAGQTPDVALVDSDLLPRQPSGEPNHAALAELSLTKVLIRSSTMPSAPTADCRAGNVAAAILKPVFEDELRDALLLAVSRQAAEADAGVAGKLNLKAENSLMECQPQEAMARLGGDEELYGDVVRRFLDDTPAVLEQLRAHIAAGAHEPLHRAAHSFKGLAGMCGAVSVAQVAAELEHLGKQNELAEAPAAVERLEAALSHARLELARYAAS